MGWIQRLIARMVPEQRTGDSVLIPPPRTRGRHTEKAGYVDDALTLPAVYRALDILATAAAQLPLRAERRGEIIIDPPAVVRRPSLTMTRAEWVAALVLDLATTGDAILTVTRHRDTNAVLTLDPVPSAHVYIERDQRGRTYGHYRGTRYRIDGPTPDMLHLTKLRMPGRLRGLGPIQAAMATVGGALDMRDYIAQWWQGAGQPSGVLTSDQVLSTDDARRYIRAWNTLTEDGDLDLDRIRENPAGIKVLGKGLSYKPLLLNPADAMWLDAQQWNALDIARLFGVPTSLMLTAPSGGSNTYANVEQDWLAFTRFTLTGYLRPIEEAVSLQLAHGQDARFNYDALLRSDRKSRFEGHEIALRAGFLTVDEVRDIEGYGPKPEGEQQQ